MADTKQGTTMSGAQLLAELDRLRAENAKLAQAATSRAPGITLKRSEKGAVSAYGLGRFPVTLYSDQWLRLMSQAEAIKAFITEHKSELASKQKA